MDKISLCMIVKNEENNLKACLESAVNYVDEIIVVDTGSTDNTKEIALRYTEKVYDFKWKDDFSAARNYSIKKASNPCVLVLDADERIQSMDRFEIRKLMKEYQERVGRILIISQYTRKNYIYKQRERVSRLFSKEFYYYEGEIHEQLAPVYKEDMTQVINKSYEAPIVVEHLGYEGDLIVRRTKTQRNIRLLKVALKQNSEDPYLLYQLGKSYYMEEDYCQAGDLFEQAMYFDLDPHLEYVQDMVESYGYTLLNSEQYEKSQQLLNVYEDFSHSSDFLFLVGLIQMNNGKFQEAVLEFEKAVKRPDGKMEGVNGYLAYYNIGVIYECLGENKEAEKYYQKCGKYILAQQRLQVLGSTV